MNALTTATTFFTAGALLVFTRIAVYFWSLILITVALVGRFSRNDAISFAGLLALAPVVVTIFLLQYIPTAWLADSTRNSFVSIAIIALAVGSGLFFLYPKVKKFPEIIGKRGEYKVAKELARLGYKAFHDVILENGRSLTQVDHIVLVGGAFVVVETKNYDMVVFGRQPDSSWTVGKDTPVQYPNPVEQNRVHVDALAARISSDILGVIVVMNHAEFPKGKPAGVISISEMEKYLKAVEVRFPEQVETGMEWDALETYIGGRDDRSLKAKHMEHILFSHVSKAGMNRAPGKAETAPPIGCDEFGHPEKCHKCGGNSFSFKFSKNFHWECGMCQQWRRLILPVGNSPLVIGNELFSVSPSGAKTLIHENQVKVAKPYQRRGIRSVVLDNHH